MQRYAAPSLRFSGMESTDLLGQLRRGFSLPDPGTAEVRDYERWYAKHPAALDHLAEPGGWYLPYIAREVFARGMPAEIALLPAVESGFDATARSPSGAAGLWQFTGATARHFGLYEGPWLDQRMNLETSTRAALDYLEALHRRFHGDWLLALAAYNAGQGTVGKLMERNLARGHAVGFRHLDLPEETRHFVPKLIALRNVVADPRRYGVTLPPLANRIRFVRVDAPAQVSHARAASLCGVETSLVSQINAGQLRGATPPRGPHRIRLPDECAAGLDLASLAMPPAAPRSMATAGTTSDYVVRRGDSLWTIARAHGLSLAALSHANPGVGADLSVGQRLVIPGPPGGGDGEASTAIVHHVAPGDTLSQIAQRYQVSAEAIARWNRIALTSTLSLGQALTVFPR